jgi:hypothetical protein
MFQHVTHRTRDPVSLTRRNPATREHNDVGKFLTHRAIKGTRHQTDLLSFLWSWLLAIVNCDQGRRRSFAGRHMR